MRKTAIITGGTKGIGRAIAESLLDLDWNVVITSSTQQSAEQAQMQFNRMDGRLSIEVADVKDYHAQAEMVQSTLSKYGTIDLLVANAGVGHFAPIDELTHDQWSSTIDINLTGVFNSVKTAIPALKESKGYIITIASLAGTNFFAKGSAYNASKFGLVGFSQAIMLDLRKYGIKVSTIMPGSVSTYFNGHTPSEADAWKIQPEDIAQLVVDLLKMDPRTLPSKVEVRPSLPPSK